MRASLVAVALASAALVVARPAAAQQVHVNAVSCARTAEEGQRARAEGKLRDARDRFQACVADSCPPVVRQDCGTWASEVTTLLPTIIVDARDADGHDIADVLVRVDGEVIATKLDGKTMAVDPGPHTLTFERIGFAPVHEKAIIKEGIKARAFVVSFTTPRGSATTADHSAGPAPAGTHSGWPWLVVVSGGAIATVGAVFAITAPAVDDCVIGSASPATTDCVERHNRAVVDSEEHYVRAAVLTAAGVVVIGAGLIWHFFEPTGAKAASRVRVTPWGAANGGGLAVFGTF